MQEARAILAQVKIQPVKDDKQPEGDVKAMILKDHVWAKSDEIINTRIATSALFTYLSPLTRQPLTFWCNYRRTMMESLWRNQGSFSSSYSNALENVDREDSVASSAGRLAYFLVTSTTHQPGYDTDEHKKNKRPTDDYTHMRSMTHLKFNSGVANSLLLSDHAVQNPSLEAINQLLFLLCVKPFCTPIQYGNKDMNMVLMEHLLHGFNNMPLNDPQR